MKRFGNLWPELTSFRHLLRSAEKARRGKNRLANVATFHFDLERQLHRLQDELHDRSYRPGPYRTFEIHEPKRRMISAAPYRDRVVHHALCGILERLFEPTLVFDSYACRRGKGTHAAVDRFTQFARQHRYVLKCDVRKFFPSVDHQVLKALLARKIKDPDILWLIDLITDPTGCASVRSETRECPCFNSVMVSVSRMNRFIQCHPRGRGRGDTPRAPRARIQRADRFSTCR